MIKVFYIVVVVLWVTTTALLHSIDGVDMVVWYLIATPVVIIRFIRSLLLIKIKS